jgi:hypothetical protein
MLNVKVSNERFDRMNRSRAAGDHEHKEDEQEPQTGQRSGQMGIDRYEAGHDTASTRSIKMDVQAVKSFLDQFYTAVDPYIEGDDPATTFASCGAVLLASVLANTNSVDILARITGFPVSFTEAVFLVIEAGGHDFSLQFADLIAVVNLYPGDFKKLEDTVNSLMEDYWAKTEAYWCDILEVLRGGYLFGGKRQWWLDEDETLLIPQEHQWIN